MGRMGQIGPMNTMRIFIVAGLAAGVAVASAAANYPINNGVLQSALNANTQGITNAGTVGATNVTAQSITLGGILVTNWNQVGGTNAGGGTNILSGTATNLDAGATNQAKALALQVAVPITTYNAAWGALATNIFSGYLATVYYNQGWGALPTNVLSQYLPSATYNTAWGNLPTNIFSGYLATALYNTGWGALTTNVLSALASTNLVNAAVAANTNLASLTVTNATTLDGGAIHTDGAGTLTMGGGGTVFTSDGSWGLGGVTGQPDGSFGQTQGGLFDVDAAGNTTTKSLVVNGTTNLAYPVALDIADATAVNGDWALNSSTNGTLQFWRIFTNGSTNDGLKATIDQVGRMTFPVYADNTGTIPAASNLVTKTSLGTAATVNTNTLLGWAATQTTSQIATSSIPAGNVTGLGNGATADTNQVIAVAVQKAGTNNPSGWQTAANVTTAIAGATNALTGSNAPTSAFTASSFNGAFNGSGAGLTSVPLVALTGLTNAVTGIISTSAIPVANVTGLGNGATANTNNVIAAAVQQAGTNNPSGWQTAANVTTAIAGATNALTGSNAPTSAFTVASITGAHYGNGSGLTSLTAANLTGTLPQGTLPGAVVTNNAAGLTLAGTFTGNGGGLTNIGAQLHLGYVAGGYPLPIALSGGSANTTFIGRRAFVSPVWITNGLIPYVNFYGTNELGTGSNAYVAASIEYPSNSLTAVQFPVTNAAGLGIVSNGTYTVGAFSLTNPIPPGQIFYIRTFYTNPVPYGFISSAVCVMNGLDGANFGANEPNQTMSAWTQGVIGAGNAQFFYDPVGIIALTPNITGAIVGDSRDAGYGENYDRANQYPGLWYGPGRLFGPYYGFANLSIPSEQFQNFFAHHTNRLALAQYAQFIVTGNGDNAINSQVQSNATAFAALFTNQAVYFETLTPLTTSSDGWSTLANQSPSLGAQDTNRTIYNDTLRAGKLAGEAGFIDVAAFTESSLDSGLYVTTNSDIVTGDGIHSSFFYTAAKSLGDPLTARSSFPNTGGTLNGSLNVMQTNTAALFVGNGSGLTNLNAANLTGTIPQSTLPGAVVTNNSTGLTLGGTFNGNGSGLSLSNLTSSVVLTTNQTILITNALNQVMVAGWVGGVPTIGVQGTNNVTALQFGISSGGTSGGTIAAGRMFSVNLNSPFLMFTAVTGANNGVGCIQWGNINSAASTGTFVDEQISPNYSQSGSAAGTDLLINRTNVTMGTGAQYHIQAGTTTNNIYANNFIVDAGGDTWIGTNSICPAPLPGGDWLWNSNHVLYWCTSTTTNKIAGP